MAATGQRHPRTIDAGQQAAELDIGALYDQYSQHVYRLCLRRLHSREDAADSVQETFLNAWRALDRGAVVASPLAWLLRIADNVCVNRFRAQRSRVAETQLLDRPALDLTEPSDALDGLVDAVRSLPTRQRRAFLRRELQGYSYDEISADLGVSPAAATALVHRARVAVARSLDRARRYALTFLPYPHFLRSLFEGPATVAATATSTVIIALPLLGPPPSSKWSTPPATTAPIAQLGHAIDSSRPAATPATMATVPARPHSDSGFDKLAAQAVSKASGHAADSARRPVRGSEATVGRAPALGAHAAGAKPPTSAPLQPASADASPEALPLPSAPDPVDSPAADAAAGPNASTTNEAPERIGRSSEGSAKVTETREVANLGNRFLADESGSGTPPHAGPNDTNPKDTGPPEHANGNGPPPHAGPNDTNPKDTGPPDHGSGDGTPPHAGPQDTNTGDSSPPGRAKGIEPLQAPSEDDARSQGNGQLGMTPDTA